MQILPFIFSFLLFFSISLTYLFDGLKDSSLLKTSLNGYFEALLTLENAKQEHFYKSTEKIKKEPPEPNQDKGLKDKNPSNQKTDPLTDKLASSSSNKSNPKTEPISAQNLPSQDKTKKAAKNKTKSKNKKYRRIYTCSQLNIYPLLKEGKQKQPELFLLFKRFLNHFYGSFFEQKRLDEHLIGSLLEKTKSLLAEDENSEINLESLVFKDQKLQELFYQILKGSGNYNGIEGYPALFDYVKVSKRDRAKICLAKCPDELLLALMGEKRTLQLIELRKNPKEFKLAAIQAIYQKEPDSVSYDKHYVVSHAHHKKSCLLFASDEKQKIVLKKQIH